MPETVIVPANIIDGVGVPAEPFPPNAESILFDGEKYVVTLYAVSEPQGA